MGLIPIHLHLRKLYGRFLLRGSSLPLNHIPHNIFIDNLTFKQRLHLKSPLIDMDNRYNKLLPSFSYFNEELNLGNWLIDFFSDQFYFHSYSSNIKDHIKNLDDITFKASSNPLSSIVVFNANIKNHVAMSILHIYSHNKPVIKTIHRVVNVITTKAKLFAI